MAGEFGVLVLYMYFTPDRLKGHPPHTWKNDNSSHNFYNYAIQTKESSMGTILKAGVMHCGMDKCTSP